MCVQKSTGIQNALISLWSGKKKQHKHKLFGPDFPRTFLTLTPGRPWVKKFLPITGAAEKRTFWCGRPRFLPRTSMTRRVLKNFVQKKFALIFWPLFGWHHKRQIDTLEYLFLRLVFDPVLAFFEPWGREPLWAGRAQMTCVEGSEDRNWSFFFVLKSCEVGFKTLPNISF